MKKIIFALLLLGLPQLAAAQELVLTSAYNERNQFVINVQKNVPGTYYLEIDFTELRDASPNHRTGVQPFVVTSSRPLITISPAISGGAAPGVGYSARYWQGNPQSQPDTAFVYRLPFSTVVERRVDSLSLIMGEYRAQAHNIDWYSLQFRMEPGDTIYAARAGQVIQVTEAEGGPSATAEGRITYKRDVNRIIVEHADGSYAEYSVLENVAVRKGDWVWPHTPIGLAGSYDGENYQIRLSVYYHRLPPRGKSYENAKFEYHYIRPFFLTAEGAVRLRMRESYRPVATVNLITREMSRREARQFQSR